jgi:hypothetical protein
MIIEKKNYFGHCKEPRKLKRRLRLFPSPVSNTEASKFFDRVAFVSDFLFTEVIPKVISGSKPFCQFKVSLKFL